MASAPLVGDAADGAGISRYSSPAMFISLKKKGQRLVSSLSDSWASAEDMGTGEDLMMARAISEVGIARRLRVVGAVLEPVGAEKSL